MKSKLFNKLCNEFSCGIHEHADTPHSFWNHRTDLPGDRQRNIPGARWIKVETNEISSASNRESRVGNTGNATDFHTRAHPSPRNSARKGTPGSGAAIKVSPIKNARAPCASSRDNCSLRESPLSDTTVTSGGTKRNRRSLVSMVVWNVRKSRLLMPS